MSAAPLLRIHDVSAGYGRGEVLHQVSMQLPAGGAVTLLGANGAGKTTLMRCIAGTLRYRGSIELDGQSMASLPAHRITGLGVASVPQGRGTFAELSVVDNLRVAALLLPRSQRAGAVDEWLERMPRLAQLRRRPAGLLSGGEQQMLAIARACVTHPRLLLCDEPSLGLSPVMTTEVFEIFQNLHRSLGLSLFIVEQNAHLALSIADHAYVLEGGQIVWDGTPQRLQADDTLVSAYLGALEEGP